MKLFKNNKVLSIVFSRKKLVFSLAISYLLSALATLTMPYLMSEMVEAIEFFPQTERHIYVLAVAMALSALLILGCAIFNQWAATKMATSVVADLQKEIFQKVNSLSFDEFSAIGTSSLLTRSTEDAGFIRESAAEIVYACIAVPTYFIGGVIMSFLTDWTLALIVLAFCPLVLLFTQLVTKNIWQVWETADVLTDEQNRIVRERLSGVRVVRAFNRDEHEHKRAENATLKMNWQYFKGNTRGGLVSPIATLLLNVAVVLIVYISKVRIDNGTSNHPESVIAVVQYIAYIVNAVIMLSWTMVMLPHVKVAIRRINTVLDLQGGLDGESSGKKLDGTVEMKDVCFRYDGAKKDTLNNVNFSVKSGKTAAIIGGTGCGKSAITKVLMAFYPVRSGSISLGGEDYSTLSNATVRDNVSVALQNAMIFEGTVKENIQMGNPNATEEQIVEVAKIAQIHDFIMTCPDQYNYQLKQAGTNLSGGQKQRLNIARTILKDASVYIFDDSFSALDFLTEKNLRTALNKYLKGKTQIIITQRASTAMKCDVIYVMDKGEIVGVGTHDSLVKDCKIYKEICQSQLSGGDVL
ncbi:MAG: ABC transporter ATP-binding protein [Clostridia bacterium]|nr:ABC transporter ATP-binding protein [Clostridia bacterium]